MMNKMVLWWIPNPCRKVYKYIYSPIPKGVIIWQMTVPSPGVSPTIEECTEGGAGFRWQRTCVELQSGLGYLVCGWRMRIDGVIKTDGACDTSSNHARVSSKQLRQLHLLGTLLYTIYHCENFTSPSPGAPISLTEPGPL
jgi:hypothetical protein